MGPLCIVMLGCHGYLCLHCVQYKHFARCAQTCYKSDFECFLLGQALTGSSPPQSLQSSQLWTALLRQQTKAPLSPSLSTSPPLASPLPVWCGPRMECLTTTPPTWWSPVPCSNYPTFSLGNVAMATY